MLEILAAAAIIGDRPLLPGESDWFKPGVCSQFDPKAGPETQLSDARSGYSRVEGEDLLKLISGKNVAYKYEFSKRQLSIIRKGDVTGISNVHKYFGNGYHVRLGGFVYTNTKLWRLDGNWVALTGGAPTSRVFCVSFWRSDNGFLAMDRGPGFTAITRVEITDIGKE
jgi:hypothetical protein